MVHKEYRPYHSYLNASIKEMDLSKYGMAYRKEAVFDYEVIIPTIIKIPLSKFKLLVLVDYDSFERRMTITDEKGYPIAYTQVAKHADGTVLALSELSDISEMKQVFYGRTEVKFRVIGGNKALGATEVRTCTGRSLLIVSSERVGNTLLLWLDGTIATGERLSILGDEIEYTIEPRLSAERLELSDEAGRFDYRIKRQPSSSGLGTAIISVDREVSGPLMASGTVRLNYRAIKRKEEGIWVTLFDDLQDQDDSVEQSTRLDFFFQLYFASPDKEVWQNPHAGRKDDRIKVLKADPDEGRLLLEREPSGGRLIYPPGSTYQLKMQRDAVEVLSRRPSRFHLPLLRLAEGANPLWPPSEGLEKSDIQWQFLVSEDRLGSDSQREFVIKSLSTSDFCVLDGPPGSGKTTAISELIVQLALRGKRILLCASTHVAIDNVLEKLIKHYGREGLEEIITPLRVGKEDNISEDVIPYSIENKRAAAWALLKNKIGESKMGRDWAEHTIDNFVIKTSNLVCGTTIGILQYPPFRQARDDGMDYVIPEFDYLIIDEASKTTLQEFLVPAIHAKRWVIVGDVKQLSPSVDTTNLQVGLSSEVSDPELERALMILLKMVFEPTKGHPSGRTAFIPPDYPRFLLVESRETMLAFLETNDAKTTRWAQRRRYDAPLIAFVFKDRPGARVPNREDTLVLGEDELPSECGKLYSSDILLVERSVFDRCAEQLPPTHIIIGGSNGPGVDTSCRRHDYWVNHCRRNGATPYRYKTRWSELLKREDIQKEISAELAKPWAHELAWRMKRVYEIRQAKQSDGDWRNYYRASMDALMPESGSELIWKIESISGVVFPSVVTVLTEGRAGDSRFRRPAALSSGIPETDLRERSVTLSYQHRMHPDISKVPRELFYDNLSLKDVPEVNDMQMGGGGEREWGPHQYPGFLHRFQWVDIPAGKPDTNVSKNVNKAEANLILREVERLASWLKGNDFGGKNALSDWSVYILTFYEAQRKHIVGLISNRFEHDSYRKERRFLVGGLPVSVYTVDKVQGREADIVFLSMVQNQRVGFMDSPNRLNVAITRGRYQSTIVGDRAFFADRQKNSSDLRSVARASVHVSLDGLNDRWKNDS